MHCGNDTHVEDEACCIVGVSGNHDNSDTRVGLRNIAAPFLHYSRLFSWSQVLPEGCVLQGQGGFLSKSKIKSKQYKKMKKKIIGEI